MRSAGRLPIDARITISRPSGADGDVIRLSIVDHASRGTIVEGTMSLAAFARAVTGFAEQEITAEVWPRALERLGLVRENEERLIPIDSRKVHEVIAQADDPAVAWNELVTFAWCLEYPDDPDNGWSIFGLDSRPNHHRWRTATGGDRGGYSVHVERYVEAVGS